MELLRRLSLTIFLIVLTGCGGGSLGESDDDDGGTTAEKTISLTLSNIKVTGANPVEVTATVMLDGAVISGEVVTFTTDLGAFSPISGTARTNDSGKATITLTAGDIRGAGTVTATVSSGESNTITFDTQGDDVGVVGDINITVMLVDGDGNETDTITSSKPGRVIATIDGISVPLIVSFATTVGDIPIPTAITDDNNKASVDIFAAGSLGAGVITASISSGETGETLLVVGSSSVKMGSGDPFVEKIADISLAQISAGGTTVVSVKIIDDQGNLFLEPVEVNFSSSCSSLPTPSAILSSPISTSNGVATSTYLAKGCVGDDSINVTANAGGINLVASGSVNVLGADIGSIEFVSASPENIALLGTGAVGGSESSIVVFKVLDTNNNPVNNQVVNFSLNTDVGGINMIPNSATTNSNGLVQTVINSGTVAATVRVTATIDGSNPKISSQSSLLVVSTGIPDQDSFSLSATVLNAEGWNRDGTIVKVTARLADAFNNPVPDGTAVIFTTEGGRIEPSCVTANGSCTVEWNSQYPRPVGHILGDNNKFKHKPEVYNTMGQKYGGRATITATAIGEESFPDLNGNGRFDANEVDAFLGKNGYSGNDISGRTYDLKEAFVDHNEDGYYNPDPTEAASAPADPEGSGNLETFSDFNVDGSFSQKDKLYNGVLCTEPRHDKCGTQKSLNVRDSLVIVMSGSTPYFDVLTPVVNIKGESTGTASVIISDLHNQPMPAGTMITFKAGVGSIVSASSFEWPSENHNGGMELSVSIKGEADPISGALSIEIETPSGVKTSVSIVTINIL